MIIIDDDPQVCEDVTAILEAAAVFADSALDAPEALRKIRSAHQNQADYDVAIVDWILPGMDGLTLTQTIHEQISEELPVIFFLLTIGRKLWIRCRKPELNTSLRNRCFASGCTVRCLRSAAAALENRRLRIR